MSDKRHGSLPWITRRDITVPLDRAALNVDEAQRTVELSFSSEEPVKRYGWEADFLEVLSHEQESVDLGRANAGAALLLNHDRDQQIGVVVRAWLDGAQRKARAVVKFSESALGQEIFRDVITGIRRLVSVGYDVSEWVRSKPEKSGGLETITVTRWEPLEVSIVSVPADNTIGVGRSKENLEKENMNRRLLIADPGEGGTAQATAPVVQMGAQTPPADFSAERKRIRDIMTVGESWKSRSKGSITSEVIQQAIDSGMTVEAFGHRVLNSIPVDDPTSGLIGASKKEVKRFSLARAIYNASVGKHEGIEGEMSDATAKVFGVARSSPNSFFLPIDVARGQDFSGGQMQRTNTAGTDSAGGYMVPTELSTDLITLLRNNSAMAQAGVRMLTGLQGDYQVPALTTGSTIQWGTEVASISSADLVFDIKSMTPKRCAAIVPWSRQLSLQSILAFEDLVRVDITQALLSGQDLAILSGTGSGGQPTGIINTGSIGAIANDAPTGFLLKDVLEARADVKTGNVTSGRFAWIVNATAEAALAGTRVDSGSGIFLIADNNTMRGDPVFVTEQLSNNYALYGAFDQAVCGMWGAIEVLVDPYTLASTGITRIVASMFIDVMVRRPVAFSYSTNPVV